MQLPVKSCRQLRIKSYMQLSIKSYIHRFIMGEPDESSVGATLNDGGSGLFSVSRARRQPFDETTRRAGMTKKLRVDTGGYRNTCGSFPACFGSVSSRF